MGIKQRCHGVGCLWEAWEGWGGGVCRSESGSDVQVRNVFVTPG